VSFPRYPKYADSGIEWLGPVPEHWEVRRLRLVAEIGPSKTEVSTLDREMCVSFLPMEAIGDDGSLSLERERTVAELESGYTYFREGDVTLAKITPCFENGKGAVMRGLLNGVGFGTTELIVARPRPSALLSDYLHYVFTSTPFRAIGESHMYGAGGQKRVPDSFVRDFTTALPPLDEQSCIVTVLDRETAKIDALIAEQKRLMELLQEKRQAVISHAVTKGLNPDSPTKPSGVEWLGDVPESWDVIPLKRDLEFVTSGSRGWAEHYTEEGDLFIRIANLTRDSIRLDLSDVQRVVVPDGAEGSRTRVRDGDVLFSITAYLGSVAVVPAVLEPAYVSQHVALARTLQVRLLPEWVGYVALSDVGQTWFKLQSYGGTKIQLSLDDIRNLPIPVPPIEEQRSILLELEGQLSSLATLAYESARLVDLLQVRRNTLISSAVTGQIDVRGVASSRAT